MSLNGSLEIASTSDVLCAVRLDAQTTLPISAKIVVFEDASALVGNIYCTMSIVIDLVSMRYDIPGERDVHAGVCIIINDVFFHFALRAICDSDAAALSLVDAIPA